MHARLFFAPCGWFPPARSLDGMDPELPPEHSLVAAVKALNVELVNEILDTHKIDLNALSAAALAHRPHRAGHPMSLSGGILHSITSMDALSITPMDVLGAAVVDHAVLSNARAIFEKLLECGASPACTDWDGFTPLHWACTCAVDWAILALIRAGAPVNATSRDGDTPLHCLFKRRPGRLGGDAVQRLVAPLLDAGADPTARRGDGLRPFDMLFRFSHCGPAAVQAERDGLLTECGAGRRSAWLVLAFGGGTSLLRCRPSNIVAGKLVAPRVSARGT